MADTWMRRLARHYEKMRQLYPHDNLIILFDIDGTILDMRYMVLYTLWAYDRAHGTRYFQKMRPADITVHENRVAQLLARLNLPPAVQADVSAWYEAQRWSPEAILQAHQPFGGVLAVIRWFQMQPRTAVGLNTGRPSTLRASTMRSLNALGAAYRVSFSDELLHMNPGRWEENVAGAKAAGVRYFQELGYRVFAFVDNEPVNLTAVAQVDPDQEILLLHADTIFESKRNRLPPRSIGGNRYTLADLIPQHALPQHIQLVWHGVNDQANLKQFLTSPIRWAECDVQPDPSGSELILRHDTFAERPLFPGEEWLSLEMLLAEIKQHGRHVKLDLKTGGAMTDVLLELLARYDFTDERLWFNGNVDRLQETHIRRLAAARPGAIIQCPVDFLAPLVCSAPEKAREVLDMLREWGVNRFSISWQTENIRRFFDQMDQWGFAVNIYNVPDLESFLQAILLMPQSVTADFNFPEWHYYGRGAGRNGRHHQY